MLIALQPTASRVSPVRFGRHAVSGKLVGLVTRPQTKEYAMIIGLNLLMTVAKTLMQAKAYKNEGFNAQDRRLLNMQEWVRQSISTALWLTSLCASVLVTKRLFPNQSQMGRILTSNLISSVPDAFVRPALTAKICKILLKTPNEPMSQPPAEPFQASAAVTPVTITQPAVLNPGYAGGWTAFAGPAMRPAGVGFVR